MIFLDLRLVCVQIGPYDIWIIDDGCGKAVWFVHGP